jgi:hypothetical protein
MSRDDLLAKLRECIDMDNVDPEMAHSVADNALMEFLNDDEVTALYYSLTRSANAVAAFAKSVGRCGHRSNTTAGIALRVGSGSPPTSSTYAAPTTSSSLSIRRWPCATGGPFRGLSLCRPTVPSGTAVKWFCLMISAMFVRLLDG